MSRIRRAAALALLLSPLAIAKPALAQTDPYAFTGRLFAGTSVWNTAPSPSATLDPSSATRTSALAASISGSMQLGQYPAIAADRYSTPIYRVGAAQPRVMVTLDTPVGNSPLRTLLTQGVPIPADARPAEGTDRHLTVYQQSTDTLWEFWHASNQADGWHAGWAGAMQHASQGAGYYSSAAWADLTASQGWDWGATASSLSAAGGTATLAELRRGVVNHALAAAIPGSCAAKFAWPAQRTDGPSSDAACLPQGARLRLDPTVDVTALNLPPVTRMLALAAQKYGIIVRDQTGASFSFFLESPRDPAMSPYTGVNGLYGGLPPWKMLRSFPFQKLQLLPMTLCTQRPCTLGAPVTTQSPAPQATPTATPVATPAVTAASQATPMPVPATVRPATAAPAATTPAPNASLSASEWVALDVRRAGARAVTVAVRCPPAAVRRCLVRLEVLARQPDRRWRAVASARAAASQPGASSTSRITLKRGRRSAQRPTKRLDLLVRARSATGSIVASHRVILRAVRTS